MLTPEAIIVDKYALLGRPAHHSLSPKVFKAFALQTHSDIDYQTIEPEHDNLFDAIESFRDQGGKGVNLTAPFKEKAYHFTTNRSDIAEQAQAVNTIAFNDDGTVYADNTDGIGLAQDLIRNHEFSLRKKSILLIGAGGAGRGITPVLLNYNPSQLIVANRNMEKAIDLAKMFQLKGKIQGMGFEELNGRPFDLIINATSAGQRDESLQLPTGIIGKETCCYDLAYGKASHYFTEWARQQGAALVLDGIGMLVEQAAAAFYLWRGIRVQTAPVIAELRST